MLGLSSSVLDCLAGEPHQWLAGTYLDPAIQRHDFFPHTISRSIPEYRQVYNRPRNFTGWIAYKIEPSSQEAMAWQTNHCNGNYQAKTGAFVPMYWYPKPWESLNTHGRAGSQETAQAESNPSIRIQSVTVESVPGKELKLVPEGAIGVEVPPPFKGLK